MGFRNSSFLGRSSPSDSVRQTSIIVTATKTGLFEGFGVERASERFPMYSDALKTGRKIFAVAPMIDGIETAKYSSKNNLGKISVAKS